jgi:hypothetical protein
MLLFFLILIIIHGLIHLMGFVKAFNLSKVEQLKLDISRKAGVLWLLTAILFVINAVVFYFKMEYWWIPGSAGIIISQVLIIMSWKDAKFGTIANVILIVPLIMGFAEFQPGGFKYEFQNRVQVGLNNYYSPEILTDEDLKDLPLPVKKYLIYTGAVGKEKIQNFKAVFRGGIKPSPDSDFLNFVSTQYNFIDEPARIFYIQSKLYSIPFDGLHVYVGPDAVMRIKIASLFQIVNAKGPEMNKSETVTLFNDMCLMAPATLIDKHIEWEIIDSLNVKARFTNQGNTVSAILSFNPKGELVDFSSKDRYESADGKIFNNYEWTTPVAEYREIVGRRIAANAELLWHKPTGKFCYGKFELVNIGYNLKKIE